MKRRRRITRARLQKLLHYDVETGEFRWREKPSRQVRAGDLAGTVEINGYRKVTIEGAQYTAHQLAWFYMKGRWCPGCIDHRDRNRSNNRWSNLRRATPSQNCANRCLMRSNKWGFRGVKQTPSGRWSAAIQKERRMHYLGVFSTPQEAHAAYVEAARRLFGEFARAE